MKPHFGPEYGPNHWIADAARAAELADIKANMLLKKNVKNDMSRRDAVHIHRENPHRSKVIKRLTEEGKKPKTMPGQGELFKKSSDMQIWGKLGLSKRSDLEGDVAEAQSLGKYFSPLQRVTNLGENTAPDVPQFSRAQVAKNYGLRRLGGLPFSWTPVQNISNWLGHVTDPNSNGPVSKILNEPQNRPAADNIGLFNPRNPAVRLGTNVANNLSAPPQFFPEVDEAQGDVDKAKLTQNTALAGRMFGRTLPNRIMNSALMKNTLKMPIVGDELQGALDSASFLKPVGNLLGAAGTVAEKTIPPVALMGVGVNAAHDALDVYKGKDVAQDYLKGINTNILPDTGGHLWNPAQWNNWGVLGNVGTAMGNTPAAMGATIRGANELAGDWGKGVLTGTDPFAQSIPASTPSTGNTIQWAPPKDPYASYSKQPVSASTPAPSAEAKPAPQVKTSAASKEPLLPHQQRVIDRLSQEDQPGLILYHSLGSGKSRSAIEAYKELGLPMEVVPPAALEHNFKKEMHKWVGKDPKDVEYDTQQNIARNGIDSEKVRDKLLVIDEAHRLRNQEGKGFRALHDVAPLAKKRLLLTGSPIYNSPVDIANLVNLAAGKDILPSSKAEFKNQYIGQRVVFPTFIHRMLGVKPGQEQFVKNPEYLRRVFHKLIDYQGGSSEGYPTVNEETIKVPMGKHQQQIYKALQKQLPWHLRMKIRHGLPPDKRELDRLVPFLSGSRMISNTSAGFNKDKSLDESPKIDKAVEFLKAKLQEDPTYKGVVYSNYLDSGVNAYKRELDKAKIPYGMFTGNETNRVRNQSVKDYNENKLKVLLLTGAGGEGLDLKSVRALQILEPHFNNPRLDQVEGRVARFHSHEGMPKDKQNVLVQRYISTVNPNWWERLRHKHPVSSDEYLQSLSDQKTELNNEFLNLIKN